MPVIWGRSQGKISVNQKYSADAPRSGLIHSDVPQDDGLRALLARWDAGLVGLVDVRRAQTEFCVAEKYRDGQERTLRR
jgi:hypothetical protein